MLIDSHGRKIDYLRVSVTDRCNLRCSYCIPPQGMSLLRREEILSYEEITEIVTIAVGCGIRKVRVTGGEPLVRKDLQRLISSLSKIESLEELSLTTNGVLLADQAKHLKSSGLQRVNISLDSLKRERFEQITQRDELPAVWRGIEKALEAGLNPVKLNVVVMRGMNDDELVSFARLSLTTPLHTRFIEHMDFGGANWRRSFYPVSRMKQVLSGLGPLQPSDGIQGSGPARYFKYENALGRIGFISPISEGFCGSCNRLRVTSDGKLRPCLLSTWGLDLKTPLRSGAPREEIQNLFKKVVERKPLSGNIGEMAKQSEGHMCAIGG